MLLAPDTGVAVIFKARMLSDVSTHVTFDVAGNQLVGTVGVTPEENTALLPPNLRKPDRTCLLLLTPAHMQTEGAGTRSARAGSTDS